MVLVSFPASKGPWAHDSHSGPAHGCTRAHCDRRGPEGVLLLELGFRSVCQGFCVISACAYLLNPLNHAASTFYTVDCIHKGLSFENESNCFTLGPKHKQCTMNIGISSALVRVQ